MLWGRRDAGRIRIRGVGRGGRLGKGFLSLILCGINLVQAHDGQIFDQPLLDLLQAEVIGV